MENKHVLFLDNISRTIFGVLVEEDNYKLVVKNPVVLQIGQTPQNKLSVQFIPLVFRDFLAAPEEDIIWEYAKSSITQSNNPALVDRFIKQYEFVVSVTPEKAAAALATQRPAVPTATPAPVKLFGEEGK